jgi:hypothetical protein
MNRTGGGDSIASSSMNSSIHHGGTSTAASSTSDRGPRCGHYGVSIENSNHFIHAESDDHIQDEIAFVSAKAKILQRASYILLKREEYQSLTALDEENRMTAQQMTDPDSVSIWDEAKEFLRSDEENTNDNKNGIAASTTTSLMNVSATLKSLSAVHQQSQMQCKINQQNKLLQQLEELQPNATAASSTKLGCHNKNTTTTTTTQVKKIDTSMVQRLSSQQYQDRLSYRHNQELLQHSSNKVQPSIYFIDWYKVHDGSRCSSSGSIASGTTNALEPISIRNENKKRIRRSCSRRMHPGAIAAAASPSSSSYKLHHYSNHQSPRSCGPLMFPPTPPPPQEQWIVQQALHGNWYAATTAVGGPSVHPDDDDDTQRPPLSLHNMYHHQDNSHNNDEPSVANSLSPILSSSNSMSAVMMTMAIEPYNEHDENRSFSTHASSRRRRNNTVLGTVG